jgi:hypothetical protein
MKQKIVEREMTRILYFSFKSEQFQVLCNDTDESKLCS